MLGAVPSTALRDAHALWFVPSYRPRTPASSNISNTNNTADGSTNTQQQQQRSNASRKPNNAPPRATPLAQLNAEEAAIESRKANIRRFGATWIRPPGIPKTYQAMVDEAAERMEQEAAEASAATEAAQAAAQEQVAAATGQGGAAGLWGVEGTMDVDAAGPVQGARAQAPLGEGGQDNMERDLDDDVPEAFAFEYDPEEVDIGSIDGEDVHDLDDDVPEAGSYQHTDTDVEDESSDEDNDASENGRPAAQSAVRPQTRQDYSLRISNVSSHAESSMLVSSPIASRGPRREDGPARRGH